MGKKKVIQKGGDTGKEKEHPENTSVKSVAKTGKKKFEDGRIYIRASYNNTVLTVTDEKGNVITWLSAGSLGFSGPKKSTPFAASKVAEAIYEKIQNSGPHTIKILVRGVGNGRDSAIRTLAARGLNIISIKDITPIPHNGPRPPKVRRV